MSSPTEFLLQDAASALTTCLAETTELSASDRAFLAWMLREDDPTEDAAALALAAADSFQATRSYHDVATMGYAAHAGALDETRTSVLEAGLGWLCGRSPEIDSEPAPFFADAVALLGIALGAASIGSASVGDARSWMLAFVPRAAGLPAVEAWQRCLFAAALNTLGSDEIPLPTEPHAADVRTALRARSVAPNLAVPAADADEILTLTLLKDETTGDLPFARAALRLAAYRWIRRSAPVVVPGRVTPTDVVRVLESVPAGLRRWAWEDRARTRGGQPRKWCIDHEYHVQDLLYFLLAPVLPDLKDEEYFPSLGQKQPRTDLFLPSLKLIIEVKFLRAADKTTRIIDEVASDASLYLKRGSDYSGLIPFVWDDSRRTEEHPLLEKGLGEIGGVVRAVIVPRPGRMA